MRICIKIGTALISRNNRLSYRWLKGKVREIAALQKQGNEIALVSSVGGHLTELLALADAFEGHELVWIVNDQSPVLPEGARAYRVSHAERDWRVAWNVFEFAAILSRERPDVLVSMGAGPAVPAAVIARLAGVEVVFVEPSSAVTALTVTGRLMRYLTPRFFIQWESLKDRAPWAKYAGAVL